MKKFLSPSTRLELLRFMNWEELLADVAEGADDGVTGATIVRTANRPDLIFDIVAGQSSRCAATPMTAQATSASPSAA